MHAAEFDDDGAGDEEGRAARGNSEKTVIGELYVPSAQNLYIAVRKEFFLDNTTGRLGTILDCAVASCRPNQRSFEILE